jgi:hypothetical protein
MDAVGDDHALADHPAAVADLLDVRWARGAVSVFRSGPFPRASRRTGRARCHASGSPRACRRAIRSGVAVARGRRRPRGSRCRRLPMGAGSSGAAHATGRSCTGLGDSRREARCAISFTTSSTSPRRCSRLPGCRSRPPSTGLSSGPWRASAWRTPSTTPTLPSAAKRSTSRCSAIGASITRAGRRSRATRPPGW